MYRVAIITLSDTASKGERIDESGRVIAEIVRNEGYEVVFQKIDRKSTRLNSSHT